MAHPNPSLRQPSVIPGFGLTFGLTIFFLSFIVLIPLSALFLRAASLSPSDIWSILSSRRTLSAIGVSFGTAFIAALINLVFGFLLAWVLVRYKFPGRRLADAAIDLPFALPTAVAGIALATLYAPHGWIGAWAAKLGFKIAYTPLGIIIALTFVGLPFVVRTVQPILEELESDIEEAAATLGASRLRTVFTVLVPLLLPALLTGFAMALARGVGEYGSVIFIAGNMPNYSEIAPYLIVIKLEEYNTPAATVIAVVLLIISFLILLLINFIQAKFQKRLGRD